ncbi:MAG: 3-isopropylmalate dehydrogenase [Clostridia bacterium]|nr:3-isopropylmalate dehydrogenase [Clostridia bacterium]
MNKTFALIRGDGIGPEIVEQAKRCLDAVAERFGHEFLYVDVDMGGVAIDKYGEPLPETELNKCLSSDAVLLGAVGGKKWDDVAPDLRPEKGLLKLRKSLGTFANVRPTKIWRGLGHLSPIRRSSGVDFVIVRELTGGVYFGEHRTDKTAEGLVASDVMTYSEEEIRRIAIVAFETAAKRRKKVCSVDKSNVLDTSRLWRKVVHEVALDYPDIDLSDMLVDNCAMQIVKNPAQFDVIVTENMFGDILSDEAAQVSGSIGLIPSASNGAGVGLYEPIHGSAPDIAGRDVADPIGTILSAAMMLRDLDLNKEAACMEKAVETFLSEGYRTVDIATDSEDVVLGCSECGKTIARLILEEKI